MKSQKFNPATTTVKDLIEFFGMNDEYANLQIERIACVGWKDSDYKSAALQLAYDNGLVLSRKTEYKQENGGETQYIIYETGNKNERLTKGHYKLAIKIFKLIAEKADRNANGYTDSSSYISLSPKGIVKVGTDFMTGRDVFKTNHELLDALIKRGILKCERWQINDMSNCGTFEKQDLRIELTDLAKTVFDSELIFEISRISQLGFEYYFQAMDMVKLYLNFFKVNKKGIVEYTAL